MENLKFTMDKLEQLLIDHEGYEKKPYTDTVGKITIGVGWNLSDKGLPEEIIQQLLFRGIMEAIEDCEVLFANFEKFSENRQLALVDMAFNLGRSKFSRFVNMRKAIANGDWIEASAQALDSRWAKQVGRRANTIANMLKEG